MVRENPRRRRRASFSISSYVCFFLFVHWFRGRLRDCHGSVLHGILELAFGLDLLSRGALIDGVLCLAGFRSGRFLCPAASDLVAADFVLADVLLDAAQGD